jgi:hypothetical protein
MDTVCGQQTCTLTVHKLTSCSYEIHSLFLRKILTFRNRKQLFNTLNLHNKALTWQYPADLMFWQSSTIRHTLLLNNTLCYSATLVRWFILDHPIRVSWPAHCSWSADFLSPSFTPTAFHDNQSIHRCLCTSYLHSTFQTSIFCSQKKFIYFCVFTHWVYLVWRPFLPCVRSETSGTSTNKKNEKRVFKGHNQNSIKRTKKILQTRL